MFDLAEELNAGPNRAEAPRASRRFPRRTLSSRNSFISTYWRDWTFATSFGGMGGREDERRKAGLATAPDDPADDSPAEVSSVRPMTARRESTEGRECAVD